MGVSRRIMDVHISGPSKYDCNQNLTHLINQSGAVTNYGRLNMAKQQMSSNFQAEQSRLCANENKAKKVCKTTAVQCYQCFSLCLLLRLEKRIATAVSCNQRRDRCKNWKSELIYECNLGYFVLGSNASI